MKSTQNNENLITLLQEQKHLKVSQNFNYFHHSIKASCANFIILWPPGELRYANMKANVGFAVIS